MPTTITGSPLAPFADALYARLSGDAALAGLARTGTVAVVAELFQSSRTNRPYVIVGVRELRAPGGAMQREGGKASVVVDVFSDFNGPEEAQDIQSRIRVLLQRFDLPVVGFTLYSGSLVCEEEQVFPDFDPDMPERSGYHGVQRWTGLLEESI